MTQAALAEMIGVDAATVTRAELMHRSAKLATYVACAEALGVTLDEIFTDQLSSTEMQIIEAFRSMDDDKRRRTAALLELIAAP